MPGDSDGHFRLITLKIIGNKSSIVIAVKVEEEIR